MKTPFWILILFLGLLAITNPSPEEYRDFTEYKYGGKDNCISARLGYCFLFSIFESKHNEETQEVTTTHIGIFNNFFELS